MAMIIAASTSSALFVIVWLFWLVLHRRFQVLARASHFYQLPLVLMGTVLSGLAFVVSIRAFGVFGLVVAIPASALVVELVAVIGLYHLWYRGLYARIADSIVAKDPSMRDVMARLPLISSSQPRRR